MRRVWLAYRRAATTEQPSLQPVSEPRKEIAIAVIPPEFVSMRAPWAAATSRVSPLTSSLRSSRLLQEPIEGFVEELAVQVDIGDGCLGAHENHVMERRDKYSPVIHEKMEVLVEFDVF